MRRALWLISLIGCLSLVVAGVPPRAQVPMTGAGLGAPGGSPPPTFTGPLDVVSGAKGWWGMRAASTADRGNKLVNVCNPSDVACVDMVSDATTGDLVVTTVGGLDCSIVTCTIKTFYDRSGALFGNGAVAWDMTQATIGNRAQFKTSAIGSKPCALFSGVAPYATTNGSASTIAQPFTFSAVANRTGSISTSGGILNFVGASWVAFSDGVANQITANSGTSITVTAADSSFHAIQYIGNSTSSDLYIDGSSNVANSGTNSLGSNVSMNIGRQTFGPLLTGYYCEGGVWPTGFNGTQKSNMNSNQRSYWGF